MEHAFSRIAIGTANWGKSYRGHQVPLDEIKEILKWCRLLGVNKLDMATAYEIDPEVYKLAPDFTKQLKVDPNAQQQSWAGASYVMSHTSQQFGFGRCLHVDEMVPGTPNEYLSKCHGEIVQVPYSCVDKRFEQMILDHREIKWQARSIFCAGRVFFGEDCEFHYALQNSTCLHMSIAQYCVYYCLMNPNVQWVIVGAENVRQLMDSIEWLCEDQRHLHDRNPIDTRLF